MHRDVHVREEAALHGLIEQPEPRLNLAGGGKRLGEVKRDVRIERHVGDGREARARLRRSSLDGVEQRRALPVST